MAFACDKLFQIDSVTTKKKQADTTTKISLFTIGDIFKYSIILVVYSNKRGTFR